MMMSEKKRFELLDETIFDNQKQAEDGGRVTYWVVEYQQRQELVELLNSLSERKEKAELERENEILQSDDGVNERFFGYDIGEYENMNYVIYDTFKCEKKKEDFRNNREECYDMRAYTEYLKENDCILSCDEVVGKLNMLNQNCIILAKRLYEVEEESRERLRELQRLGLRYE